MNSATEIRLAARDVGKSDGLDCQDLVFVRHEQHGASQRMAVDERLQRLCVAGVPFGGPCTLLHSQRGKEQ